MKIPIYRCNFPTVNYILRKDEVIHGVLSWKKDDCSKGLEFLEKLSD